MPTEIFRDPDFEWLDMLQPTGLVVGRNLLRELGLVPERQTQVQSAEAAAHIEEDTDKPALKDPWAFVAHVLSWEARHVAGTPGGPPVPDALTVRLPEHDTTLAPTWRSVNSAGATSPGNSSFALRPASTRTNVDLWLAGRRQRISVSSGCCARPGCSPA
jgi:hypothetical protein